MNNDSSYAQMLGCKVGRLLTKYLGLPLCFHYKSSVVWDEINEKIRSKFLELGPHEGRDSLCQLGQLLLPWFARSLSYTLYNLDCCFAFINQKNFEENSQFGRETTYQREAG